MSKLKMVNVSNFHAQYSDLTSQHWHSKSESYAGGDNLVTALSRDWAIAECVLVTHWYAGMRSVQIYKFTLTKDGDTLIMPVLNNPYVYRFVVDQGIEYTEAESRA